MPDLVSRFEWEEELAKRFVRLSSRQFKQLLDFLGWPPNWENVPYWFWEDVRVELSDSLVPVLAGIYIDSVQNNVRDLPTAVDMAILVAMASEWAKDRAYYLVYGVDGIVAHTITSVRRKVEEFDREPASKQDFRNGLLPIFGAQRGDTIGVTETTFAITAGLIALGLLLFKQNLEPKAVWFTRRDERVCPVCGGLHGVEAFEYRPPGRRPFFRNRNDGRIYEPPPAHVYCRCWWEWEF